MKLRIPAAIAAVAMALLLVSSASAQFESAEQSPLGVALTIFRPSSSELKSLNSNWIGATVSFQTAFDDFGRPAAIISMGWSSQDDSAGTKARLIPVRASYIKRFGGEEGCWYVGAGLGLYWVHFERGEISFDPTRGFFAETVSDNGTKLGTNLSFGREFGGGWFLEFKKDMVPKLAHKTGGSIDFSGWCISIGSRLAY